MPKNKHAITPLNRSSWPSHEQLHGLRAWDLLAQNLQELKDLKSQLQTINRTSSTIIGFSKTTKPNKLKSSNPCRSIQPHFISTMAERQKMEPDKFAPEGDEDEQEMRIKLLIFRSKNKKLLEMDSFLPLHTYLGSCQTTSFGKKKLETLGDAQSIMWELLEMLNQLCIFL